MLEMMAIVMKLAMTRKVLDGADCCISIRVAWELSAAGNDEALMVSLKVAVFPFMVVEVLAIAMGVVMVVVVVVEFV